MAILWGPFTYTETDQTTLAGGHTVKSIPIDFTGFPSGANALTLVVVAGQVQYDNGNFANVSVILGGTAELYTGAPLLWSGNNGFSDPTTWSDWPTIIAGDPNPTAPFTSPGPGITNLNFQGDAGASAPTPAGFRNFTIRIDGPAPTPAELNPLNFERSVTQWRVKPKTASAFDGNFVFTLGYDGTAPNIEDIAIGDYIQVAQPLTMTGVGTVRARIRIKQPQTMPDRRDISKDFQLVAESGGSPGNIIIVPAGVSELDVGRTVTVAGCTNGGNNGVLKIVGIIDPISAYVNKTLVTEGPRNGTITAIEDGARWKLSLLVDNSGLVERARIVQDSKESGFYRSDLTINVSKLTGVHNIYFRMTLVNHNSSNIYAMP